MIRWPSNSNSKWCELSKDSVKFIYFEHFQFPIRGTNLSVYLIVLEKHSQFFNAECPLTHRCASYMQKKYTECTTFFAKCVLLTQEKIIFNIHCRSCGLPWQASETRCCRVCMKLILINES